MAPYVCPRRNGSVANGALGRSQKLLSKVASMLTSIYRYGQVAGVAHTYVVEPSMAVELIRSAPLPAEH